MGKHKKVKEKKIKQKKETALVVKQENGIQKVDDKTLMDYICGVDTRLTDSQKVLFIKTAKLLNLNPLLREIYAVGYWSKDANKFQMSIIVGYETYLKRAERSRKLAGWKSWTEGDVKIGTLKGKIIIYRSDWKFPLEHEVDYNEYVQRKHDGSVTKFWNDKPKTMIKKVVEAQGFRKAFPVELGGMPYTADEMPSEMGRIEQAINITPEKIPEQKKVEADDIPPEIPAISARQEIDCKIKMVMANLKRKDSKRWTNEIFARELGEHGVEKIDELTDKDAADMLKIYEEELKCQK